MGNNVSTGGKTAEGEIVEAADTMRCRGILQRCRYIEIDM